MTPEELTGQSSSHIKQYDSPRFAAHPDAGTAFLEMAKNAKRDGVNLYPFSAFRDFNSQARIWNLKFSGNRPLLNQSGAPIDREALSEDQVVKAILRWTALPGASRHHWGSEIDVIDGEAITQGQRFELIPRETEEGGIFYDVNQWLDQNMDRFGFFRPYSRYQGGVYPEPWHISFAAISVPARTQFSLDLLAETINNSKLLGKNNILSLLDEIYSSYVRNISSTA